MEYCRFVLPVLLVQEKYLQNDLQAQNTSEDDDESNEPRDLTGLFRTAAGMSQIAKLFSSADAKSEVASSRRNQKSRWPPDDDQFRLWY